VSALAVDLLRIAAARDGGRLRASGPLARAVRGALIVDALRDGIVRRGEAGYESGPNPPRTRSMTELTAGLLAQRDFRIVAVLQHGRPRVTTLAREMVDTSVWSPAGGRPGAWRYADAAASQLAALQAGVRAAATGEAAPVEPAFVALAISLGLDLAPKQRVRDGEFRTHRLADLIDASGEDRPVVETVVRMNDVIARSRVSGDPGGS
jgi:hypothetical protein